MAALAPAVICLDVGVVDRVRVADYRNAGVFENGITLRGEKQFGDATDGSEAVLEKVAGRPRQ